MIRVVAESIADRTKFAEAAITYTSDIVVSVMPTSADVELGTRVDFSATAEGTGNFEPGVTWSFVDPPCGQQECGAASSGSSSLTVTLQTPGIMPPVRSYQVRATAKGDSSKSGTGTINLISNFTMAISGPTSVVNGASANYIATVTPVTPNSSLNQNVTWSVSGAGCTGSACGTIDVAGLYSAPLIAPNPAVVTITATSVADLLRSTSIDVTVLSEVTVTVTPNPGTAFLEGSAQFTATVAGTTNTDVTWDVNGIVGGDQNTVGAITQDGLLFAPVNKPIPNVVTVGATSVADPSKRGTASVGYGSNIVVSISPNEQSGSLALAVGRRMLFSGLLENSSNMNVLWSVTGRPGGTAEYGFICTPNITPCIQRTTTTTPITVEYEAPPGLPPTNPVFVAAASEADPDKRQGVLVTILLNVEVSVLPQMSTLANGETQQFLSSVRGTSDQRVTWSLSGASCSGGPCGTLTSEGLYTAPASSPSDAVDTITVASVEDPQQIATATVRIATGPLIRTLAPSSTAVRPFPFTLRVVGAGFEPGTFSSGSVILLNGTVRVTACADSATCTINVDAGEPLTPGLHAVQVRNQDGNFSNQVSLVAVERGLPPEVIPLTQASPSATDKDIIAVDPVTNSLNEPQINIEVLGVFVSSSCTLRGSPLAITRPAAGSTQISICVRGAGLTPSHQYTLSGPADIGISVAGFGPAGSIELVLTLNDTTQLGPRTLFVRNDHKEKAAATGAIEVKAP